MIAYDSQDISKTFMDFNAAYQKLLDEGLPLELTIQQIAFNPPTGRAFGVIFVWSGDDKEEGQRWKEKIASLGGPVVMDTVVVTTIPEWFSTNAALVASSVHGSSRTHTVHHITPEVAASIGRSLAKMPSDPVTMFTIHELRGPSAAPRDDSVFAMREPHFMLEIMGCVVNEESRQESRQWISNTWQDIQQTDSGNILPTVYISLHPESEEPARLSKFFGPHVEEILALKRKFDPENVFSLAVPELK